MADALAKQRENPRAEEAFEKYVSLGVSRSLAKLAAIYQSTTDPSPTKYLETLKLWSVRYNWQARIANAATARSEALLQESAQIDAETFTISSRHLRRQIDQYGDFTDATIKIRESVRKPLPKSGASVNVGVNVTLTIEQQQIVERIAASRGLDVDDVMDELQAILKAKA